MSTTPGYDPPCPRYRYFSGAECIWKRRLTSAYNCHLVFRRKFHCESTLFAGELRVTASDFYRIYINGQYVGEGPARSERGEAYVDHYNASDLPISSGNNVIVVMALNKNLAEHGQPPKDGGLALTLDGHGADGSTLRLRTGKDWKVREADWYLKPAPRRFFPVGFNELVDFRRAPDDLLQYSHDDSTWDSADIVSDAHLSQCRPRPLPPYLYNHIFPMRTIRAGKVDSLEGVMGVSFLASERPVGESARFKTSVYAEKPLNASLFFGCDNRAKVWLNQKMVWEQGSADHGFRKHLSDYEDAAYEGMFHGHGLRMEVNPSHLETARCQLHAGWNELEIQIDFLDKAYGFELAFVDDQTRRLPLHSSAEQSTESNNTWVWRSSDAGDWLPLICRQTDQRPYLEPSHLAFWEGRQPLRKLPSSSALGRSGEPEDTVTLQPGEYIEFELETYAVGFAKIILQGPPGAIIDLVISERNDQGDDRIAPMHIGLWQAERLILSGGVDHYAAMERRAGRYISVCVRKASGPVEIHSLMMRNLRYDHPRSGEFSSNDSVLNWIWQAGARTIDLSTFDLCEDCPTREMAQWSGDTFLRAYQLACYWGDLGLSAKALREFADDQLPNRWGRAMVPAGYGDSLVDYALLLPVWTRAHYQITGDRQLVARVFQGVRNLFKHAETLVDQRGYIIPIDRRKNQVYLDMRLVAAVRKLPCVAALQAYFVRSLDDAACLADLLKQSTLAEHWREQADRLRKSITRDFWAVDASLYMNGEDAEGHLSPETGAETNYIMLWAGVPDEDRAALMLRRLFPEPETENLELWPHGEGVYLKHFMADALFQHGRAREALTAWRGFYGAMTHHLQTVPEAWSRSWAESLPTGHGATPSENEISNHSSALRSLVHPFGAGPMWHMMTYLCGIQSAEPGYRKILWQPMPGDLQQIEARFPLPGREDYVEFSMEPNHTGGRDLRLRCPADIDVETEPRWLNTMDRTWVV